MSARGGGLPSERRATPQRRRACVWVPAAFGLDQRAGAHWSAGQRTLHLVPGVLETD